MYCKYCGKTIDNDSKYCYSCGGNITLPKEKKTLQYFSEFEKYDLSYPKETDATIYGFTLLGINIIGSLSLATSSLDNFEHLSKGLALLGILGFILRIFITNWVIQIAKRLNRDSLYWGIFGFCLPSLAMIFIGQKKKIKL